MSLEQIVAPAVMVFAVRIALFGWRHAAPWWRRHVHVRGELEVRVRFNDDRPAE